MDERDFARFEFKMSSGRLSYIAEDPWLRFGRGHQERRPQLLGMPSHGDPGYLLDTEGLWWIIMIPNSPLRKLWKRLWVEGWGGQLPTLEINHMVRHCFTIFLRNGYKQYTENLTCKDIFVNISQRLHCFFNIICYHRQNQDVYTFELHKNIGELYKSISNDFIDFRHRI